MELGRVAEKKTLAPLKEAGYGIRATEILATGEDCVQEDPDSFEHYYSRYQREGLTGEGKEDIKREYSRHYKLAWESDYGQEDIYLRDGPWDTRSRSLNFIYGDEDSAALYRISSLGPLEYVENEIGINELEILLDQDALDVGRLIKHIGRYNQVPYENLGSSLKAFASFIDVYHNLPEATIALKIAYRPLHEALWARHAAVRECCKIFLSSILA